MKEIDFSTAAIFYLLFSLVQFCYIDFFEFVSRHLQRLQVFLNTPVWGWAGLEGFLYAASLRCSRPMHSSKPFV